MSQEGMRELPQIQSILTPLLWTVVFNRHGKESLGSDIYPMRSGKQFANTMEDNIQNTGAMDKLISDSAKNEISHKVKDILKAYNINDWQSEPYHQNQNPAEWRYRTIKV